MAAGLVPPTIEIASIGIPDTMFLMLLALVVFGPRRLPEIGRQIGKLMYEFRKVSNDFKFQMEEELRSAEEADRRKKEEEQRKALELAAPPPAPVAQTIEAEAGIGAVETATASPYPGEGEYPAQYPPEAQAEGQEVSVPQIMPPSTGERVAAARPGSTLTQAEIQPDADEKAANHG